jgi:hypothetical protein
VGSAAGGSTAGGAAGVGAGPNTSSGLRAGPRCKLRLGTKRPCAVSGQAFIQFLAGRGANRLRLAEQLARLQRRTGTVLAAQKTRHGGGTKRCSGHERRTRHLGAVAQAVVFDLGFRRSFGQGMGPVCESMGAGVAHGGHQLNGSDGAHHGHIKQGLDTGGNRPRGSGTARSRVGEPAILQPTRGLVAAQHRQGPADAPKSPPPTAPTDPSRRACRATVNARRAAWRECAGWPSTRPTAPPAPARRPPSRG